MINIMINQARALFLAAYHNAIAFQIADQTPKIINHVNRLVEI